MPRLSELLIPALVEDPEIGGSTADSAQGTSGRSVRRAAGRERRRPRLIPDALRRGACAIIAPRGTALGTAAATLVIDDNPRRRFAQAAARFYAPQPQTVVAVTGTNGKTSVANFSRQIWAALGQRPASWARWACTPAGRLTPARLTTPDPVDVHRTLGRTGARARHPSGAGSLQPWPRPVPPRRCRADRRRPSPT